MNSQDKINLLFEESEKVSLQDIFKSLNEIIILQGFLLQTVYELTPVLNWQDYNLCNYLFIRYLQLVFSHFFLHKVIFSLDFRAIVFLNSETEFF